VLTVYMDFELKDSQGQGNQNVLISNSWGMSFGITQAPLGWLVCDHDCGDTNPTQHMPYYSLALYRHGESGYLARFKRRKRVVVQQNRAILYFYTC
jgi:hypothetical protein